MKILEINTFNKVVGGVESYVFHMARALENRGHQVVPLYLMPPEDHPGLMPSHRGYYMEDLTPHHTGQILEFLQTGRMADVRRRFADIVEREQPDLIHCNNIYSPIIVREYFPRLPVVRTVHDYRFLCPILLKLTRRRREVCREPMGLCCFRERCVSPLDHHAVRHMLYLRWEREVSKDFDRLVTKSRHMKDQLVQSGVPAHKVTVVPLSVELPDLAAREPDARPTVLYVGRIAEEKGVDLLVKAVSRLGTDCELVLAGDGPEVGNVRSLVDELGLGHRVTFAGWTGGEALRRLYDEADLVAVPSIWPEPFGLVGLEAMSHARPVVAFDVGGVPEWLDHEHSGLIAPVGDEAALRHALDRLLTDPDLARQLGQNGRREVEGRFVMDVASSKLIHLFENLLRR